MDGREHFVVFDGVCKYYQMGETRIAAADHISFYIDEGEFCVIVGPSGAGKTTVLNMLGGMDVCDEGHIWLDGAEISAIVAGRIITLRGASPEQVAALPGVETAAEDETSPGRVRAACTDSDAALAALFTGPLAGPVLARIEADQSSRLKGG